MKIVNVKIANVKTIADVSRKIETFLSKHIYGMTDLYNTVVRDYLTARSISRTVALLDRERT
jgi:hydrogenase maturation factor HypE